ncbi:non-specific lipid transfer protein GPI-anchored 12-like [Impatiens glandulifera]|uniref:non-specific lipid transfer protein GPI-anchored 12-like n=1 Tax=Impatiens glandulifera TaxID=253017 RepID=UPI001FB0A7AF|nr:non-specific lipid transfer protein GPI-anchored 12-like [Impatiens glandulifera]
MTTAKNTAVFVIISAIMLTLASGASPPPPPAPESPAPEPSSDLDCFPYLLNVSDCLSYVEKGSNLTDPEKGCCPELSRLVGTQPICLCQLLGNSSASLGIDIDVQKALKLPQVCSVSTPPTSYCAVAGYPVVSPSGPSPTKAPGVNPTAAAAEAETPEVGNKNGGSRSNINGLLPHFLAMFFAVFVFGLF